jgi:hypothetical protein
MGMTRENVCGENKVSEWKYGTMLCSGIECPLLVLSTFAGRRVSMFTLNFHH